MLSSFILLDWYRQNSSQEGDKNCFLSCFPVFLYNPLPFSSLEAITCLYMKVDINRLLGSWIWKQTYSTGTSLIAPWDWREIHWLASEGVKQWKQEHRKRKEQKERFVAIALKQYPHLASGFCSFLTRKKMTDMSTRSRGNAEESSLHLPYFSCSYLFAINWI